MSKINKIQHGYRQKGLSLIEVPIGLFVIAVIFLLYNAAANSVVLNRSAKYQEVATRIGISTMEDLRATSFDSLPSSGPLNHSLLSSLPSSGLNLNVVDLNANIKEITITVSWKEPNLSTRNVTFSSLMSRYGL